MKKTLLVVLFLLLSFSFVASAGSMELGFKANTEMDFATFTNLYMNDSFSVGASLATGVQTASDSLSLKHVQVTGKYHAPSVMSNLSFFGGGGFRMGLNSDGGGNPVSSVLVFGTRVNSVYGLNLIGELNLVSPISDLTDYKLEPWFGLGFRF